MIDENRNIAEKWAEIYGKKEIEHLKAEVERVKAKLLGTDECLETWKSAAEKWEAEVTKLDADLAAMRGDRLRFEKKELDFHFNAGMERAAVISEEFYGDEQGRRIAAAIRAGIKGD